MHPLSRITISWAANSALLPAAARGRKTCHAPSAPRMAHGQHHARLLVAHHVAHDVARAVARKSLPECSLRAASARPVRIPARAAALLLRKDATGFRALSLKPASLLRKAQASLPVPRSHRAPAGQGQRQNPRGGQLRNGLRALGQNRFPSRPPALPRPTGGLFPRFAQSYPDRQSGALRASTKHRIGRVWGRSLLYRSLGLAIASSRDRLSQRWGASFPLLAWGLRITALRPGGLRKLSLCRVKIFRLASAAGTTTHTFALGNTQTCLPCAIVMGCGRSPIKSKPSSKVGSIVVRTFFNPQPNARPNHNKELINCYAAH